MSCIKCSEINTCGTVARMLRDYSKSELLKQLQKPVTDSDCKDFTFIGISGEILRDKLLEMINKSSKVKAELKQAKNR